MTDGFNLFIIKKKCFVLFEKTSLINEGLDGGEGLVFTIH